MFAAIESQEVFVQELHEIVETYFEEELVIEGEFVTEQTMLGWGYSECLGLLLIPFRGSQCDHACSELYVVFWSQEAGGCHQEVLLREPCKVPEAWYYSASISRIHPAWPSYVT